MRQWTKAGVATAGVCALMAFSAGPAFADATYHSSHYDLNGVGGARLRSGFVQNIHANGPNVYAHEQYVLNGAKPKTTYHVVLNIFPGDLTCSGAPAVSIPVATIRTNAAGNGAAYHVFIPMDADGLHGATVGGIWTVSEGASPDYRTGCETIVLD